MWGASRNNSAKAGWPRNPRAMIPSDSRGDKVPSRNSFLKKPEMNFQGTDMANGR
jgi:hypothetical protein